MAERQLICGQCGATNPPGNNYCGRCGVFLGGRAPDDGERWRPSDRPGEPRARRQAAIIYSIAALFALSCLVLSLVVIIWRP